MANNRINADNSATGTHLPERRRNQNNSEFGSATERSLLEPPGRPEIADSTDNRNDQASPITTNNHNRDQSHSPADYDTAPFDVAAFLDYLDNRDAEYYNYLGSSYDNYG